MQAQHHLTFLKKIKYLAATDGDNTFMQNTNSCVYLIGAGPGDPDLLTVKAARLLASAEVVIYDHLVGAGILDLIPATAQRLYVGKESGRHSLCQEEICRRLVEAGRRGGVVVRLKGGDPYIFGRGGEEVAELAAAGLHFEVVPGITAASGMAACAGIPLTHRDHAQSCLLVTGHLKDGSVDLDWVALARPRQTVVIYMGVGALDQIARELIAHGVPPTMPAAVVRNASLPDQQVVRAPLAELPAACRQAAIKPPALIVIGTVVALAGECGTTTDTAAATS